MQKETASPSPSPPPLSPPSMKLVHHMVSCNTVVVFSMSDCCMSIVAKHLLFSIGVGPTIVEVDKHVDGPAIQAFLHQLSGAHQAVPAVFVGGKFIGGVQALMTSHINGTLVPLLKEAGALWL